jgi:hypothetical protein
MPLDQIGELEQHLLAFVRLYLPPGALESPPRRGHCTIDVFRIALSHLRQDFACCGIDALECLAGRRLDPLAVDQQSLGVAVQERGGGSAQVAE